MKNQALKAELITSGTFKEYRKKAYDLYLQYKDYDMKDEALIEIYGAENAKALKQLLKARRMQISKIKNHINFCRRNDYIIFFFTFTYDDEKRKKEMKPDTLKKYVIRALRNADDYILNIDYGSKTERLHFHAIVFYKISNLYKAMKLKDYFKNIEKDNKKANQINDNNYIFPNDLNHKEYIEKVGNMYIQKLGNKNDDEEKIARYITKLTLHTIKVKQKYISTKKGSDFQQYADLMNRAKAINKQDKKDFLNNNISIMDTILSSPKLKRELQKYDKTMRQFVIKY